MFIYSTYFAFGWVDLSAGWIIGEVLYVIFERYEGFDVELCCNGLFLLVNIVNNFLARLFVGCRYVVLYWFFVLGFVELIEVSCVVGGDEGFRRICDSLYFLI